MFFETFNIKAIAMKHERFLKTGSGREYIRGKIDKGRGVAQLASALASGARGHWFKSSRPDHVGHSGVFLQKREFFDLIFWRIFSS